MQTCETKRKMMASETKSRAYGLWIFQLGHCWNQANWKHLAFELPPSTKLLVRVRNCFGKPVLKHEMSVKVSPKFPAVSWMSWQAIAEVNGISFLFVFSTKIFITFHTGFTFQKLSYPSHGITVIRKLPSYILVKHFSRISSTYKKDASYNAVAVVQIHTQFT